MWPPPPDRELGICHLSQVDIVMKSAALSVRAYVLVGVGRSLYLKMGSDSGCSLCDPRAGEKCLLGIGYLRPRPPRSAHESGWQEVPWQTRRDSYGEDSKRIGWQNWQQEPISRRKRIQAMMFVLDLHKECRERIHIEWRKECVACGKGWWSNTGCIINMCCAAKRSWKTVSEAFYQMREKMYLDHRSVQCKLAMPRVKALCNIARVRRTMSKKNYKIPGEKVISGHWLVNKVVFASLEGRHPLGRWNFGVENKYRLESLVWNIQRCVYAFVSKPMSGFPT